MRSIGYAPPLGIAVALLLASCSSSPTSTTASAGTTGTTTAGAGGASTTGAGGASTTGAGGASTTGAGGASTTGADGASTTGTGGGSAGGGGAGGSPPTSSLDENRDRLLGTYLDYLKASAPAPQSNGLSGGNVASVCDLWAKLQPSAKDVFLTLTARLQGSTLGADGNSMLAHVTKVYRIAGGQGATANDPGSCGGGEYNRMILSMDGELHDAQLAAFDHQGALQPNGKLDIADIPASSFWRDSHDLSGAHTPFDRSDETDQGAPRGQTQYFADPGSAKALSPLGRMDLMTLVDPFALEMDQDYDCIHNSNPDCAYITYKPLCFPGPSALGTEIYTQSYGSFEPGYQPSGCGG